MTVTDTDAPPAVTSDAPALAPPRPATGLAGLLGTGDDTRIGRLYIGTSFLFLLASGVYGALIGVEKVDPTSIDVIDVDSVAEVFSIHAVSGVLLFLVPLLLGLAMAIVPAQIGAKTLAFPRAAAAAYWSYLVGGIVLLASFAADGGPGGSDRDAVALFLAALILVLVSLTLGAVCVATTGLALRAEGMTVRRTPLFTWANVVGAGIWILTFPVLAGIALLCYIDVKYGPTLLGSSEELYLRISWAWSQPAVYMYAIPVLGIIGDVVPVGARTRLTQHRVALGFIGVYAALSFGAWAMPAFAPGGGDLVLNHVDEVPFVAVSFLIIVPLLGLAGLLADTMRKGAGRVISPLVWVFSALLMLLAGAANGALVSVDAFDLLNTSATSSQIHYVLAATTLGLFGGLVYWAPVLWGGRRFPEGPSILLAVGGLVGTVVLCLPDLISGFLDQGSLLAGAPDNTDAIEVLNVISLIGGVVVVLVALGFIGLLLRTATAARDGEGVDEFDPWEGHTLEWAGADLPAITSEAPVYDARHAEVSS